MTGSQATVLGLPAFASPKCLELFDAQSLKNLQTLAKEKQAGSSSWSLAEDQILRKAVLRHDGRQWKSVASYFRNRSDLQCLQRWQKVLNPLMHKGAWTAQEDSLLEELVVRHGAQQWSYVSTFLPGRIGKQCRERWCNHLRPGLRRGPWTAEEINSIVQLHRTFGNRWSLIAKRIPGRTDNAIKNFWNAKLMKVVWRHSSGRDSSGHPVLDEVALGAIVAEVNSLESLPAASADHDQNSFLPDGTRSNGAFGVLVGSQGPSATSRSRSSAREAPDGYWTAESEQGCPSEEASQLTLSIDTALTPVQDSKSFSGSSPVFHSVPVPFPMASQQSISPQSTLSPLSCLSSISPLSSSLSPQLETIEKGSCLKSKMLSNSEQDKQVLCSPESKPLLLRKPLTPILSQPTQNSNVTLPRAFPRKFDAATANVGSRPAVLVSKRARRPPLCKGVSISTNSQPDALSKNLSRVHRCPTSKVKEEEALSNGNNLQALHTIKAPSFEDVRKVATMVQPASKRTLSGALKRNHPSQRSDDGTRSLVENKENIESYNSCQKPPKKRRIFKGPSPNSRCDVPNCSSSQGSSQSTKTLPAPPPTIVSEMYGLASSVLQQNKVVMDLNLQGSSLPKEPRFTQTNGGSFLGSSHIWDMYKAAQAVLSVGLCN